MPLQKGKKRKKARRHGPSTALAEASPAGAEGTGAASRGRSGVSSTGRPKWKPPLWMNATFGTVMIVVGIIFYFVIPQKGGSSTKLLFLVLYIALGGLYLGRAYLEYRRRQQSS